MGSSERSVSRFLEEYETNEACFIQTIGEPEPVGVIAYTVIDRVLDIRDIAVDPGRRGRGSGTRLIRQAIEVHLPRRVVAETDDDAVAFYRKLGFITEPFMSEWGTRRYRVTLICQDD